MASGTRSPPHLRRRSIKELDDELISSGILTLTGGRDRYDHLLVVFPPGVQDLLCTCYTAAHLFIVIRYYYSICYQGNHTRGLAFLVNLRDWKKDCIQLLVDTLDTAQTDHRGTVGVVYAIQPKSKDLQKLFKKLTGLRLSKRNPKTKQYETVVVSEQTELLRYMDIRQLTDDFGGSLQYSHKAWITFMLTMDDLEDNINKTLDKLPEAHDKLSMMSEYDIPADQSEVEVLLSQIRNKFQDVMRDLNLEHMIDECKAVVSKLSDPAQCLQYKPILHTPSYNDAKVNLEQYERQLIKSREDLKATWQAAEVRVLDITRMYKYRNKAEKVLSWLKDIGLPAVEEDPLVAKSLVEAESLKKQFEEGFFSISKNVLWLADKIVKKLEEISVQSKESGPDLVTFSQQFQTTVDYFRKLAQNKMTVYVNVHQFYMSSQKLTQWYSRTLRFLPLQLLWQQPVDRGGIHDMRFLGSNAWVTTVNTYLLHHPAPKSQHLPKLKGFLPVIDNIAIRSQARLLVHRVGVLCTLLKDPSKVSLLNMQGVFRWQKQVLAGHDDITLNFDSIVLDAGKHGPAGDLTGSINVQDNTASRGKLVPKLKSGTSLREIDRNDREYFSLDRRVNHPVKSVSRHQSLPHIVAPQHVTTHTSQGPDGPSDNFPYADVDSQDSVEHHPVGSERYISLGYSDVAGPSSLQHVSFGDLTENKVERTHDGHVPSSVSRAGAGLVSTQAGGSGRLRVPVTGQTTRSLSVTSRSRPKSLPDIRKPAKSYFYSSLDMDTVVNSNLSAEEKLDLMTKICEGEGVELSPELHYKLCTTQVDPGKDTHRGVYSDKEKVTHSVRKERSRQQVSPGNGQQSEPGVESRPASAHNIKTLTGPQDTHHQPGRSLVQSRPVSAYNIDTLTRPQDTHHQPGRSLVQSRPVSAYNIDTLTGPQDTHHQPSRSLVQSRPVSAYNIDTLTGPQDTHHQPGRSLVQSHPVSDSMRQRSTVTHQLQRDSGFVESATLEKRRPRSYHFEHDYPELLYGVTGTDNPGPHDPVTRGKSPRSDVRRIIESEQSSNQNSLNSIRKKSPQARGHVVKELDTRSNSTDSRLYMDGEWTDSRLYMDGKWTSTGAVPSPERHRRKPSKRSSIKVQEWMRKQGDQFVVKHTPDAAIATGNERKRSKGHTERLDTDREEKKELASFPSYMSSTVTDVSAGVELPSPGPEAPAPSPDCQGLAVLQQAEKDQDAVEQSLQNTEKILQEQEELLCQTYELGSSPSSTNSSVTLLEEPTSSLLSMPAQHTRASGRAAEPTAVRRRSSQEERQWEGSLSEESGVYTHTSTDSRLRMLDLANDNIHAAGLSSSSLQCLSAGGPSLPSVLQEDCGDSSSSGSHLTDREDGHRLQVCKEASLGDSSSQTTVMTEIHREQSLSSDSGGGCVSYPAHSNNNLGQNTTSTTNKHFTDVEHLHSMDEDSMDIDEHGIKHQNSDHKTSIGISPCEEVKSTVQPRNQKDTGPSALKSFQNFTFNHH